MLAYSSRHGHASTTSNAAAFIDLMPYASKQKSLPLELRALLNLTSPAATCVALKRKDPLQHQSTHTLHQVAVGFTPTSSSDPENHEFPRTKSSANLAAVSYLTLNGPPISQPASRECKLLLAVQAALMHHRLKPDRQILLFKLGMISSGGRCLGGGGCGSSSLTVIGTLHLAMSSRCYKTWSMQNRKTDPKPRWHKPVTNSD